MITVYGAGYVGLVSAVCFATLGHKVCCVDINPTLVKRLQQGECPIYEAQLADLLNEQLIHQRLIFTTDMAEAVKASDTHFIATGTPTLENGEADLNTVYAVANAIATYCVKDAIIIIKSTVPVGTGRALEAHIQSLLNDRKKTAHLTVASNPEFLREGSAVADFLKADRIILGTNSASALTALKTLYHPLAQQGIPIVCMSRESAELTKYAANGLLAAKISFINQISLIAERSGADIEAIRQGMALDKRIGPDFLQAGIGYGGSCFPKDVKALTQIAHQFDIDTTLLTGIETINRIQKQWVFDKMHHHFHGKLRGLTIGLWGLSFKPGTDDIREASSLVIIEALLQAGVFLRLFDPVAMAHVKNRFSNEHAISWCASPMQVIKSPIDGLIIATEWPIFKTFSLTDLSAALGDSPLFDGRNCYDLNAVKQAKLAYYYSVGRPKMCHKD